MTNNMAYQVCGKVIQKLYTLQMAPVLCDVWQMGCHADTMADGQAM